MPLSVLVHVSTHKMASMASQQNLHMLINSTINQLLKFTKSETATRAQGERVLMTDGAEAEFAPCSSILLHCSLA